MLRGATLSVIALVALGAGGLVGCGADRADPGNRVADESCFSAYASVSVTVTTINGPTDCTLALLDGQRYACPEPSMQKAMTETLPQRSPGCRKLRAAVYPRGSAAIQGQVAAIRACLSRGGLNALGGPIDGPGETDYPTVAVLSSMGASITFYRNASQVPHLRSRSYSLAQHANVLLAIPNSTRLSRSVAAEISRCALG